MATVTIPAYSEVLEETATLHAPEAWHERIKALVPHTTYGPDFERGVLYSLTRMSITVEQGYSALAYDWLLNAEQIAKRAASRRKARP
jgi:hypothetical protein